MKNYLLGVFDDDEIVLEATRKIRGEGIKVTDVLTPFAVHGMEDALGMKDTRLHTAGFIFGGMGAILMLSFISWINAVDYPTIYGGKPHLAWPAFIPITFEFTVLSASVGMVIAFFVRCGFSAIRPKPVLDTRITNDKFVMAFDLHGREQGEVSKIRSLLKDHGAVEVTEKEVDRWYDF